MDSSSKLSLVIMLLIFVQTMNPCMAGRKMMGVKVKEYASSSFMAFEEREKLVPAENLYFAKLPKDVPIPPSGPSERHNSAPPD
ncbi:hypothetical protein ABFX02_12G085500 [Erythranthe guttata]